MYSKACWDGRRWCLSDLASIYSHLWPTLLYIMQTILATVGDFELTSSHGWEYNEWGSHGGGKLGDRNGGMQPVSTPAAFEYIHYTSDQVGWQQVILRHRTMDIAKLGSHY